MRTLFEAIGAMAEEVEKAKVAEDLELLADFGADVAVWHSRCSDSCGDSENENCCGVGREVPGSQQANVRAKLHEGKRIGEV